MGVTWAQVHTRPFSDAVTAGVAASLRAAGPEGDALLERLEAIQA